MRLAAVSDIHGNLPALLAVHAEIERCDVDAVFNLGDIVSGPLWPVETVEWLMARNWPTVAGNHERQLQAPLEQQGPSDRFAATRLQPAHKRWLAALPGQLRLPGDLWLIHGTPDSDHTELLETVTPDFGRDGNPGVRAARVDEVRQRLAGRGAALLLCGHTHMPRVCAVDGTLIVNPGSVGLPAYHHDQPHVHHMETGSPHARWALLELTPAGWRAELRLTAYDASSAAARAEAQGRGDWADALLTGRVGRTEDAPPSPGSG
jgi:predicted phosphodiesterase